MLDPRWRLLLSPAPRGSGLSRLSPHAGASTEFRDHRDYAPGDDPRHIDWRAYARTDRLLVKRFFEESLPDLALLLDRSASMQAHPGKADRADALARGLEELGRRAGMRCRTVEIHGLDSLDLRAAALRPGCAAVLLSDLLSPAGPDPWISALRPAAAVAALQILSPEELDPRPGLARLTDAETGLHRDLAIDDAMIRRYRQRLDRLSAEAEDRCRNHGWIFARVEGEGEEAWRGLMRAGVIGIR